MKRIIITTKWIPCDEALPPEDEDVLVYYPNAGYGIITIDSWAIDNKCRFYFSDVYGKPTHWMPLPKPPKGAKAK